MNSTEQTIESLSKIADSAFFKALAHPNRLALFEELCHCGCECCRNVGELAECCNVDMSVVSRHLAKLREAGIVEATRNSRQVEYRVNAGEVASILRDLADAIERASSNPDRE